MTTTYTILNLTDLGDVDILSIPVMPKSSFIAVPAEGDNDDLTRESVYQKKTGDTEFPMIVRAGHYKKPAAYDGVGKANTSVKSMTYCQKDVDGEIQWTLPYNCTIALDGPTQGGVPDRDGAIALISATVSLLIPIIAGVQSGDALDEVRYGIVSNLLSHVDSASV